MKNIYNNYISKTEKLIAEKTKAINKTFKNARNINTAVAKLYDEERVVFNELQNKIEDIGLSSFFRDIEIALDLDKKTTEKMAFDERMFNDADTDLKIEILAQFSATKRIIQFIDDQREVEIEKSEIEKLHWGGIEQTEFVQLIYSMIESGFITDKDKIGKYKIVQRFARFFNFPLNKNWEDNLSSSVNDRNNSYEPEIFNRLKTGWTNYRDSRLEINKKNSKMKNSLRKSDLQTQFP